MKKIFLSIMTIAIIAIAGVNYHIQEMDEKATVNFFLKDIESIAACEVSTYMPENWGGVSAM